MTNELTKNTSANNEYNPNDPELQRDRKRAQTLIKIFNDTSSDEK